MKMKKEKSRGSAKRLIIILSLSLALIIALGAFSFAWIRNYVSVDSLGIQTGKLLYDIKVYDGNGNKLSDVFTTPTDDSNSTGETVKITDTDLQIKDSTELFFVIKKHADSIDFDVALSFDWDRSEGVNYDYVGQLEYSMYDASSEVPSSADFDNIGTYITTAVDTNYPELGEKLTSIFDKTQDTSLSGETDAYACIRLKITVPEGETNIDLSDKNFHLKTKFCVAQTGALDDGGAIETIRVTDTASLKDAMASYGYGDTIYIESSDPARPITHDGDLVFTRPCKVVLVRTTLEITGNLIFSYIYDDYFELSTAADGHIKVMKNGAGDGGHFQIELPNATMKLTGANNVAEGKADVYVDGNFTANASTDEAKGITFERLKVCQAATADSAESLKPLTVDGSSRIVVANSTNLGALSTDATCKKLHLINKGSIEAIDLRNMAQDTTYLLSPTIFVDNYGVVGGDKTIYLPVFSIKYDEAKTESGLDNTRIIANKGSELIKAITPNDSFPDSADGYVPSQNFFSTGVKMTDGTTRDDIEYDNREIYVEKVNGDPTKIVVHYENIPPVLGGDTCETLKDYIEYYSGEQVSADQKIAAVKDITEMKVICYSGKVLDSKVDTKNGDSYSDYNFINNTMDALTTLDLSESGSEDMRVPDNAFKGMTALTDVKMPERDIIWGKNIFTNTGVDEITFPQALTTLDNYNSSGKITAQLVLDGIKYVRTSITVVDGMWIDSGATQYLFTPDKYTRDEYRALYFERSNKEDFNWNSKIFIDGGAIRDGDFFYRNTTENINNPTCEFVVYTGNGDSWISDFDFNVFKGYTITSYDPYALYKKLEKKSNIVIELGENIKDIGEFAFSTAGITNITVVGAPEKIGRYAFAYNKDLVSFTAPEITVLEEGNTLSNNASLKFVYIPKLVAVYGDGDISKCPALQKVDISVIPLNTADKNAKEKMNKGFYTSDDSYSDAKFYIHTENAMPADYYEDDFKALAANYRHIFVDGDYAKFYRATSTYTGVTDMGENNLAMVKKDLTTLISANINGNDLQEGETLAYYYIINGSNAELVACMLPKIDTPNKDFVTISQFTHNGVTYPVSKIGSAAYHFTAITAQNIKIHDNIKELGNHVFNAEKSKYRKYCITLNLNNVTKLGKAAFYYVDMVRITGNLLEEVGQNTFSNNSHLTVANLPNLSRSRPEGSSTTIYTVFSNCSNLQIAYTGASSDISFDNSTSKTCGYVRFIKAENGSTVSIPAINTIIAGTATPPQAFSNNYVNTDLDFSNIYLSDYYDYEVNVSTLTATVRLPGYVYFKKEDGTLTLFAVSPHISKDYVDEQYTTPSELYVSTEHSNEYTSKAEIGTTSIFDVTSIGKYAYGLNTFDGLDSFSIGEKVKDIEYAGLRSVKSLTESMLKSITTLNLNNVESLGDYACYLASMSTLNAQKLKSIGKYTFSQCTNLAMVYLPSFVEATGTESFNKCTALKSATFGENAKTFSDKMFSAADNLEKITILNDKTVVGVSSKEPNLLPSSTSEVKLYVRGSIYDNYIATYPSGFAGIPIEKFGNSSEVKVNNPDNPSMSYSLTYYWEVIDGTTTAYLDYVEGTFPESGVLELPSSLTSEAGTFTIVSVKPSLMSALSEITDVTLPSGMSYLSFTTADLADSIKSLSIGSNSKFKTVGGVLYTKDEDGKTKTLLVCPKALMTADGKLTVADSVTEIFDKAFYGSKYITELEIAGAVTVRNEAFAGAGISTIKFTDTSAASVFAGKDIFLGANVNLQISVPSALLDAYKTNVLIDYSIKFITH